MVLRVISALTRQRFHQRKVVLNTKLLRLMGMGFIFKCRHQMVINPKVVEKDLETKVVEKRSNITIIKYRNHPTAERCKSVYTGFSTKGKAVLDVTCK